MTRAAITATARKDATRAMRTTSGARNPAYPTTITRPPTTAPAGATLLAPNAVTRADPIAPSASSHLSGLLAREGPVRLHPRLAVVLALPSLLRARASTSGDFTLSRQVIGGPADGRPVGTGFLAEGGYSGFDGRVEVARVDGSGEAIAFDLAPYLVHELGEHQAGAMGVKRLVEYFEHVRGGGVHVGDRLGGDEDPFGRRVGPGKPPLGYPLNRTRLVA